MTYFNNFLSMLERNLYKTFLLDTQNLCLIRNNHFCAIYYLTVILPTFLCSKNVLCFLVFKSAAYIQVHFRLDFIIEANTMNPNQTAPFGIV